jgi:hypothetical protein
MEAWCHSKADILGRQEQGNFGVGWSRGLSQPADALCRAYCRLRRSPSAVLSLSRNAAFRESNRSATSALDSTQHYQAARVSKRSLSFDLSFATETNYPEGFAIVYPANLFAALAALAFARFAISAARCSGDNFRFGAAFFNATFFAAGFAVLAWNASHRFF